MEEPYSLDKYTVVIFCPLVVEMRAVFLMLDEHHQGVSWDAPGQVASYILGRIGHHNVAIAGYPEGEFGMGVSGSMASEAMRDFPKLRAGFLVGVAAGIPSSTSDIRFGDVAVAVPTDDNSGIVGYDLVKVYDDKVEIKQWQNSTLSSLRTIMRKMRVTGSDFTKHLSSAISKDPDYARPYPPLPSEDWPAHKPQRKEKDGPKVHYGAILSGNEMIKSKKRREELRDRHGGIAIEMAAAGMMTRLPVAVIRGISDFADASENKEWQPYAALTAAAYAKEMLLNMNPLHENKAPGT
ncbi:purine and uridine phosphorylase [Periconia macrospinosa]|uniref:Purine and uridine phosphorylase n=1 Tax=Periconia macrospinosa TaxID=97972 RepID=A0A2V1D315_9PLEO|nr:purine and uridine phosphorylase [Periconia macrospinosa]